MNLSRSNTFYEFSIKCEFAITATKLAKSGLNSSYKAWKKKTSAMRPYMLTNTEY